MEQTKSYLQYQDRFKKINLLSLIMHALSLILVFAVIFLPLFSYSYTHKISLSDFNGDYESYLNFLATLSPEEAIKGEITALKSFSLFDELMQNLNGLQSEGEFTLMFAVMFIIYPCFTIISGAVLLFQSGKQLYSAIKALNNIEDFCLLEYSSIKKSGSNTGKKNFLKGQFTFTFIVFFIFTIIFAKLFGFIANELYASFATIKLEDISFLAIFTDISAWIFVIIAIFIAYLVASWLRKKEKNDILLAITKEEYQTASAPTACNTTAAEINTEEDNNL